MKNNVLNNRGNVRNSFLEKNDEYHRVFNSIKRATRIKDCYYISKSNVPCDSKEIIKAHSIQNNKILSKIAKNGICITHDTVAMGFREIGRKVASTFTGFCKEHDKDIFRPIEDYDYSEGDREQEFLFAYRAAAKQFNTDRRMLSVLESCMKECKDDRNTLRDITPPNSLKSIDYERRYKRWEKNTNSIEP